MATFTFSDNVGISGYGVNQSNTEEPSYTETSNTSITWTASNAGTYYVWVKDTVGNKSNETFTIVSTAFCAYNVGQTWNYDYTGGVQSFSTPCNGTYKLEVWGAQGATSSNDGVGANPGYGGYSVGNTAFSKNQVIYVVVGGAGGLRKLWNSTGGYNGGGASVYHAEGGGATHIGTRNGTLVQYGNTNGLYIVAGGGGGGGHNNSHGGSGGGSNGGSCGTNGNWACGHGASQSSGGTGPGGNGSFGKGGQGNGNDVNGGGGGLYGGGAGRNNGDDMHGGGGGSGYIGGVSGGSMQNGVRTGNGYARITLVSLSN